MSHASLRMIVHVANGVWRSVDQFATEEQRRDYVMPGGDRRPHRRLHADRADRRHRRRPALRGRARGRHLLPLRREAPDHLRRELRPLAALRAAGGDDGRRGDGRAAGRPRHAERAGRGHGRVARRARDRPRAPGLRPRPGAGRRHARRGGRGPAGRLRRLPHPEPDRGRDDLRRAGAAGAGAGRRARGAARHLRQAALPAPGDLLRAGRERRRHRSLAPARPARGAALGGGRRPTPRSSPRWRS